MHVRARRPVPLGQQGALSRARTPQPTEPEGAIARMPTLSGVWQSRTQQALLSAGDVRETAHGAGGPRFSPRTTERRGGGGCSNLLLEDEGATKLLGASLVSRGATRGGGEEGCPLRGSLPGALECLIARPGEGE